MLRTLITPDLSQYPREFHSLLEGAVLYDSSCSPNAKVTYIDRDGGYFLKTAPKGTLAQEAAMTRFFHGKGLGPEVLGYCSPDADWLLTRRIPGEDCLHQQYLSDPKRLCDTVAELLRTLHDIPAGDCPVNRTETILAAAREHYRTGHYDKSLFPDNWGYTSAEEAWKVVEEKAQYLRSDTLLHGDYCLPNILLQDWKFSGFIDLGAAGLGDRHIDLFWGVWSLSFNLKTDAYRARFLDAYGRDKAEEEKLRIVAALEVFG